MNPKRHFFFVTRTQKSPNKMKLREKLGFKLLSANCITPWRMIMQMHEEKTNKK